MSNSVEASHFLLGRVGDEEPQRPHATSQQTIRRKPVPFSTVQPVAASNTTEHQADIEKPRLIPGRWVKLLAILDEWWVWEMLSLLGSAVGLIVIAVILKRYDRNKQPSWDQVSLNSVVSTLSTISRLLILVPLSSGIGQLKWYWMVRKRRTLADLGIFDSASRGPLGSISLLQLTKGTHIAALGAITTIVATAFDPFNQNLIRYYQDKTPDTTQTALVANASGYDTVGPLRGGSLYQVDPILKANVYSAIFNPRANQTWGIPEYFCHSGNCTWDPIATLETRSLCSDITSYLERRCSYSPTYGVEMCNMTIPDGPTAWYLDTSTGKAASALPMILEPATKPLIYTNASAKDVSQRAPSLQVLQWISALGLDSSLGGSIAERISNDTRWIATECSLELYVRSVAVSVVNSTYSEATRAVWSKMAYEQDPIPGSDDGIYFKIIAPENPSLGVYKGDEFYIGFLGQESIKEQLLSLFAGNVSAYSDNLVFADKGSVTADIVQALFIQNFTGCATPDNRLSCMMENVARAMSKTFRDSQLNIARASISDVFLSSAENPANMAVGTTEKWETFVYVRWPWITLPVLVWVMTAIMWVSTAVLTWREKLQKWKNNISPLLFLYQEDIAQGAAVSPLEDHNGNTVSEAVAVHGETSFGFTLKAQAISARLSASGGRATLS